MFSTPDHLVVKAPAEKATGAGVVNRVSAAQAGWELLNFEVRRIAPEGSWTHSTGDCEMGLVILGGVCSVASSRGNWPRIGARSNVFAGMAHALYLPCRTEFTLTALSTDFEVAT